MRFMVMVMATKESEAGPPPKPEAPGGHSSMSRSNHLKLRLLL
jgi:hypothetical protein